MRPSLPRRRTSLGLCAFAAAAIAAGCGGPESWDRSATGAGGKADGANPCAGHAGVCIHVDLSLQRLLAYRDSTLVRETSVATGLPGFPTFPGAYKIELRYRSQTMSDGATYSVFTEWVQYFDLQGLGRALHSAPWRAEADFGRPGSHGCVNLRNADAKLLWDLAGLGTPVYVTGNTPGAAAWCIFDRCESGQRCGAATVDPCQCGGTTIGPGARCALTLDGHGSAAGDPPTTASADGGTGEARIADASAPDPGETCLEGRCDAQRVCVGGRWRQNTTCAIEAFDPTRVCNAAGWCDWP
jgi:hypothetical protein